MRHAIVALALFGILGCSSQPSNSGGVTVRPSSSNSTAATSAEPQANQVNVCTLFSAADAQSIMGVPMKLSDKTNQQRNCMYEEAKARPNTIGPGTVALTLVQSKSADEENRAWASMKETRHLQAGEKNVQVLSGIGDEAFFTGNTQKGKVGVAGLIARKGKSHFAIDTMVLEYIASPDAMKNVAKRVAGQLQ
jgi:hypothetical protein